MKFRVILSTVEIESSCKTHACYETFASYAGLKWLMQSMRVNHANEFMF